MSKLDELRELGEKYSKVTEYYDLIEGDFLLMPAITQKLVNQVGEEILKIIGE